LYLHEGIQNSIPLSENVKFFKSYLYQFDILFPNIEEGFVEFNKHLKGAYFYCLDSQFNALQLFLTVDEFDDRDLELLLFYPIYNNPPRDGMSKSDIFEEVLRVFEEVKEDPPLSLKTWFDEYEFYGGGRKTKKRGGNKKSRRRKRPCFV
jgi:hypothetical protein